MKKPQTSVVRRSVEPKNVGRPLTPPLAPSVMYHYEDVSQLQSLHDHEIEGFTYSRDDHPNASSLDIPNIVILTLRVRQKTRRLI